MKRGETGKKKIRNGEKEEEKRKEKENKRKS